MKVLLDTCCLAELQKPQPHPNVPRFLKAMTPRNVFTSVVVIGEIVKGIELRELDGKRVVLENWLKDLKLEYAERILPVSLEIAEKWGEVSAIARKSGRPISVSDALLAATALSHDLHIVTRNVKDFAPSGVQVINLWESRRD